MFPIPFLGIGFTYEDLFFTMKSLILAQDER